MQNTSNNRQPNDQELFVRKSQETRQLDRHTSVAIGKNDSKMPISADSLFLYVADRLEPIQLQIKKRVTLGRSSSYADENPQIDLTDCSAWLLGVSRMHAEILRRGDKYYVRDLGSANGTWVNDTEVMGNKYVEISDGDTLRLGHLVMIVSGY